MMINLENFNYIIYFALFVIFVLIWNSGCLYQWTMQHEVRFFSEAL